MSPLSFLNLPAELRNSVYAYLSPIHCHTKECAGFLFSCKQIYYEYESESIMRVQKVLAHLECEWQSVCHVPLHVSAMKDIATQQNMEVLLPRSMYHGAAKQSELGVPHCLKPIFLLCLESLRFGLYDDEAAATLPKFGTTETNGVTATHFPYGLLSAFISLLRDRNPWYEPSVAATETIGMRIGANALTFELGKHLTEEADRYLATYLGEICATSDFTCRFTTCGKLRLTRKV